MINFKRTQERRERVSFDASLPLSYLYYNINKLTNGKRHDIWQRDMNINETRARYNIYMANERQPILIIIIIRGRAEGQGIFTP